MVESAMLFWLIDSVLFHIIKLSLKFDLVHCIRPHHLNFFLCCW